jgi:hypothetical protein
MIPLSILCLSFFSFSIDLGYCAGASSSISMAKGSGNINGERGSRLRVEELVNAFHKMGK